MLTFHQRKFLKRRMAEIAQDINDEVEYHLEIARTQEKKARKGSMPIYDMSGSWHRRKASKLKIWVHQVNRASEEL